MLFPVVPFLLAYLFPESMQFTNIIKPAAQIVSLIPQIVESARSRTTRGISMLSQHLNAVGGIFGIVMCIITPPVSMTTYIIYLNSLIQSLAIYFLAFFFGELSPASAIEESKVYEVILTEDEDED